MAYFLAVLLTMIGSIAFMFVSNYGDDRVEKTLFGIATGMLLSFITVILTSLIVHISFESKEYLEYSIDIVAFEDNSQVSGDFFLGSGQIAEEMRYIYMAEHKHGYKMDSVSANGSYIRENDNEKPRVDFYSKRFENTTVQKWFPYWTSDSDKDVVITVPERSIKQDFNVDLE